MSDKPLEDAQPQAAKQKKRTRERGAIYGDRKVISLRLEVPLHQRLMELVSQLSCPANLYITDLIEKDLERLANEVANASPKRKKRK